MYNAELCQIAKEIFIETLNEKTASWKADSDKYVRNTERLIRDDIMDVLKVGKEVVVFTDEKTSLNPLTKKKDIPQINIFRFDAMVAYAAEMGIELSYYTLPPLRVIDEKETYNTMRVMFKATSNGVINYISERMEVTMSEETLEQKVTEKAEKEAELEKRVNRFKESGEFIYV